MAQQPVTLPETVDHMETDSGVKFGLWGKSEGRRSMPLLFILASTIDETLGSDYFRQCGTRLALEHGWLCVSLDLPYHGTNEEVTASELRGWANAVRNEEAFVQAHNHKMKEVLNFLLLRRLADPDSIAVCGTSRGGFLALHFAAVEARVKSAVVFAPVTDLSAMREFNGIRKKKISGYLLDNLVDSLAKKNVWIVIGDRDKRVGTDAAIRLARKISEAAIENGAGGAVELNVMFEPKGHTTPKGSVSRAEHWLLNRNYN